MTDILVLLDPGHGCDTVGKFMGDLHEYEFARDMARRVSKQLTRRGIRSRIIVTEDYDVPLRERTRRVNAIAATERCILVSLHLDASGNGDTWGSASGCSFRVAPNRSSSSERLARAFLHRAIGMGLTGNRAIPPEGYWIQNLAICRDTSCPAVLAETLFMDNREDHALLTSEQGKQTIARLYVSAITKYIAES